MGLVNVGGLGNGTPLDLKGVVDSVFVELETIVGKHPLAVSALKVIQNLVDNNWAAIAVNLPASGTVIAFVDSLIDQLTKIAGNNWAEKAAINVVKVLVDNYLKQILGV